MTELYEFIKVHTDLLNTLYTTKYEVYTSTTDGQTDRQYCYILERWTAERKNCAAFGERLVSELMHLKLALI
jgi:hypothetical protein